MMPDRPKPAGGRPTDYGRPGPEFSLHPLETGTVSLIVIHENCVSRPLYMLLFKMRGIAARRRKSDLIPDSFPGAGGRAPVSGAGLDASGNRSVVLTPSASISTRRREITL
jgi:hypothetical protein